METDLEQAKKWWNSQFFAFRFDIDPDKNRSQRTPEQLVEEWRNTVVFDRAPWYIKSAVNTLLERNPEYSTPDGCRGNCIKIADELITLVEDLTDELYGGYVDGNDIPHSWAVIGEYCIDLSKRQFDPKAPAIVIWKHGKPTGASHQIEMNKYNKNE